MSISKRTLLAAACMCLLCGVPLYAVTRNVSKTPGAAPFTTVQAAINASAPGDVVQIIDASTYNEQVTIDSTKNGLTLTSSVPTALNKPKIVYQDLIHVHPKTYAESQVDSLINWDQNGAVRIMRAQNVTVNGIAIDGGGPYVFGYGCVWLSANDLVGGNAALTIWVSGGAHITNCDISNAYLGINFKDRNQGGIFANANPADLQPQNIVPMSGFAKTGNHIIEYNRVHNNSFGLYFESSWDLGVTIRYNLIFENHHQTPAFATTVDASPTGNNCGKDGKNQPGGAMMFKDVAYSPVSIYNNTFWHNFLIFIGGWRPGAQHLIFNNIFAKPFEYWSVEPIAEFRNDAYMDMSAYFPNRMYNCIFSCQSQAPQTGYVSIMNGIPQPQGNPPAPGSLLSTATANAAFPAAANIRWIEMDSTKFLSMDPATANFLTPNWNDPVLSQYVKNQGWQKSGVKNMDGSWADIGAVASDGGRPTDLASIRPIDPVSITGTSATIKFSIDQRIGQFQNPTAKLFRFVGNLPPVANWDPPAVITAANINDIVLPAAPVLQVGVNVYTVTIPVAQTNDYAFFEGIFEGTDVNGKKYTSSTGFLPYRNLNYKFIVKIFDYALTKQLDSVTVGDTVILNVIPQKKDGTPFSNTIIPVVPSLSYPGDTLWSTQTNPLSPLAYPQGITLLTPTGVNRPVLFTKVPPGGIEIVNLTGVWRANPTDTPLVFQGSANIRVRPGPAAEVLLQDPWSKTYNINPPPTLPQGAQYPGLLFVYDKYGNRTNKSASIALSSLDPTQEILDTTIATNDTGAGRFSVRAAPAATQGSLVRLQALLAATNDHDTAFMMIGPPVGELFIFYGDTNQYNSATRLEGQVGDYLPVTIIATKATSPASLSDIDTGINVTFTLTNYTPGLAFYNSRASSSPTTTYTLVHGRVTVWVSSATDSISNGQMTAGNTTISASTRQNIYITRPLVAIDSAFYYSRTGFGMVDSVDIYYKAKLTMIPDSIALFWPGSDTGKRVILSSQMTLAADSMHITIVLASPFAPLTTAATTANKQGISYNKIGASESASSFAIKDRVGPLIMTAQVVERIPAGAGFDTLYVSFSEPLDTNSLAANPLLLLIHNGGPSALNIVSRTVLGGNRVKFVVSSATSGPVAGDSLRIQPGGPLADALGNFAHPYNRPVMITLKPIPPAIVQAWYLDKNADGTVDAVDIRFTKSVWLPDVVASLTWGVVSAAYADSIQASRLSYPGADSLTIEINAAGAFKSISADSIKTSGPMTVTVGFKSMPDAVDESGVADSAAPVIVSANYFPGLIENGSTSSIDTLSVVFSEPIATITSSTPFKLYSNKSSTPYTFSLNVPSLPASGATLRFIVTQIQGVTFPQTGDSMWIDPTAGVGDAAPAIQKNPGNRRVALQVAPIPYKQPPVTIVKNPFTIGSPVSDAGVSGTGTILEVTPLAQLSGLISFSARVKIFDALGNAVVKEAAFTQNPSSSQLYYKWDGRNLNSRYVGTGAYVAVVTVTDSNGKVFTKKFTIGVKR